MCGDLEFFPETQLRIHFSMMLWTKTEPHTEPEKLRGGLWRRFYKLRNL